MNFYEADIIKTQKRIKKIEENPDPRRLKSTKLRYEARLKSRKAQVEAWRQGKPFIDVGFLGVRLFRSMGFMSVTQSAATQTADEPLKLLEQARAMGLPVENSCDMTYGASSMFESGDLPAKAIALCGHHACTPMELQLIFMSYKGKTSTYHFDIPFEDNEASLEYLVKQFHEFIELAEKEFPGVIKYDENRLIELQAREEAAISYNYEIFEMLKHKPSPIAGYDVFYGGDLDFRDLEYVRARRDELAERVEKGFAAVPGEKLRMLWAVTRPFFMNPFKTLAKRGIAVISWYSGIAPYWAPVPGPVYYGGRKLTPLEKEAARGLANLWQGSGARWVNSMIWICRELKIDAIVNYNMLGCTATLSLKRLVEEQAEKELGIPTLQLEGKQWDFNYANEATINAKLDEFAQMCLARKGLA